VTFDVDGRQVDGANRTWKFRVAEKDYEDALKSGIVYTLRVPVKKAGAYQMRVALRDATSARLGTATQFIEIPDVKKGKLALSGIILGAGQSPAAADADSKEGVLSAKDPNSTPAVRIFKQGSSLVYAYEILNARTDRNKKYQIDIETRLFRDGEQIYASPGSKVSDSEQKDRRLVGLGQLQLNQIQPGDYVLQVIVTDRLASEKNRIAAQAMNFEIQQ
jgi:hypothetical protein